MTLTEQTQALRSALVAELPDGAVKARCAEICEEIVAQLAFLEVASEKVDADALAGVDIATLAPVEKAAWLGVTRARRQAVLDAAAEAAREAARVAEEARLVEAARVAAEAEAARLAEGARLAAEAAEEEAAP